MLQLWEAAQAMLTQRDTDLATARATAADAAHAAAAAVREVHAADHALSDGRRALLRGRLRAAALQQSVEKLRQALADGGRRADQAKACVGQFYTRLVFEWLCCQMVFRCNSPNEPPQARHTWHRALQSLVTTRRAAQSHLQQQQRALQAVQVVVQDWTARAAAAQQAVNAAQKALQTAQAGASHEEHACAVLEAAVTDAAAAHAQYDGWRMCCCMAV